MGCVGDNGELTLQITGRFPKKAGGEQIMMRRVSLFGTKTSYNPKKIGDKYEYNGLVGSIVIDSSDNLISQSVNDGEFYGIFGTHTLLKGDAKWWCSNWTNIFEFIQEGYNDNYRVYSLEADEKTGLHYLYMIQGA